MIITRTPYRLSLFGGGTDYNDWFEVHGGRIMAAAMRHYCYLTVRRLPPFFEHTMRIVYSKIESVSCGSGSWGGRCLSMGDYVMEMGATRGATAAGGC